MSWYRIGTVSVTNANPTITGAGGTAWAANIQAGDAFKGPDDKLYEVQSVSSDTSITLGSNYLGTTAAGAAYAIIPTQGRVRDLAAAVLQLITDLGDVDSALTVVSGRVGLGKSPNASARLDVSGQVWVDAPAGDATLRMLVSAAEKGKLGVTSAGRAYIESNGAEVMTWLNGNVGIGTAAPTAQLHIVGVVKIDAAPTWPVVGSITTAGSYMTFLQGNTVTPVGYIGTDGGGILSGGSGDNFGIRANTDLLLMAGGILRMRIDTNGNVIQTAPASPPALTAANQLALNMTSNTNLRISGRGSDGTTRVVNLTLA